EYSHFRLTFSQTFNSLGTFIGPYLGAVLFLKGIETKQCEATTQAARLTSLAGIDRAYFWICGFIIALALLFIVFRRTVTEAAPAPSQEIARRGIVAVVSDALSSRWALLGGLVIFTLTLGRSTASNEATSGFLCFSIIGGALIPPLVGLVSQQTSYVKAFIVPAACYAVLFLFSVAANRARVTLSDEPAAATIH